MMAAPQAPHPAMPEPLNTQFINARVALVHDWLNGMRGGEKVLEGLSELFPAAPIYTLFSEPSKISDQLRRHAIHQSFITRLPGWRRYYRNMLPVFPAAIGRFDFSQFDLIVSSSHCVAKAARRPKGALHICYCHAPMRYVWDLYDQYLGGHSRLHPKRLAMDVVRSGMQRWDRRTADRVDHFIANSHYIAGKIRKFYNRDAVVIHPPVDIDMYQPPPAGQPRQEFFLVASALVAYKRIDIAVRAFTGRRESLVVAGHGPELDKLRAMAPANIKFIGWQAPGELRSLYQQCRALIFPGIEDFGIVPVEAMACGAPVIAYGEGGLTETVVDGETGILYKDQSVKGLRAALDQFHSEAFDAEVLRRRAEQFSRARFIAELRDFIAARWREHRGTP